VRRGKRVKATACSAMFADVRAGFDATKPKPAPRIARQDLFRAISRKKNPETKPRISTV
jgi:hypothetical protein